MGIGSSAPTPPATPPPVRSTNSDSAQAAAIQKKKAKERKGRASTQLSQSDVNNGYKSGNNLLSGGA